MHEDVKNTFYLHEDLSRYKKSILNPILNEANLVFNSNFECHFQYQISDFNPYVFVAYDGYRSFNNGKFKEKIQVCGILAQAEKSNFDFLQISGTFKSTNSSVMPVGLDHNLNPLIHFHFKNQTLKILNSPDKIYSLGLYSRLYPC